eukprot:2128280-Pleurochrysis_carterae.AAC.2
MLLNSNHVHAASRSELVRAALAQCAESARPYRPDLAERARGHLLLHARGCVVSYCPQHILTTRLRQRRQHARAHALNP